MGHAFNPHSRSSRRRLHRSLVLGLAALAAASSPVPGVGPSARTSPAGLDASDRVACQISIEEVLWEHRIWPDENPGPKPGFWEVMSTEALAAKATATLARTRALAELWDVHVTPAMLQAEIDRQAANTRDPALLQDLWAALGHQPRLVAECLARPALVNRLLEERLADDSRFGGKELDPWWSANGESFAADEIAADGSYHLPAVGEDKGLACGDTWDETAAIPLVTLGRAVWTGSEMIFIAAEQGHRYNPATDTWETMTTVGHPGSVTEFSAVWTGTEMITWGGCTGGTQFCTTHVGGRYNPTTDTWTLTSLAGAASPRRLHDAVWTGSEMIVWGGCTEDSAGNQNCRVVLNTGGRRARAETTRRSGPAAR